MALWPRRRALTGSVASPESARRADNHLTRPDAMTASGMRVGKKDADQVRRLIQPWQSRAFAYYDLLGEIKYSAQFYSRALASLRLYAAKIDADGDLAEIEDKNDPGYLALERIQDPGGGRTALLSSYGRLMFLAGEALLFVTVDPGTEREQWEMLSTDELRVQSGVYTRYKAPSLNAEQYHEPTDDPDDPAYWEPVPDERQAVAYRIWQRHPRYSMLADSTMQGVLDLCEELVILTQAVRARARSRMAGAGILLIDERVSPAPLEPVGDEDPQEDVLLAALTDAMTKPITDEGSASAVCPIIVRVPMPEGGDVQKMMYHLQIIDPTQLYPETGLRMETIKRIAIGLDMPPEILLGMTDANHWTGWMIDEQTWKHHLQPKAQQLVDDLNTAFFRPFLRSEGVADWDSYYIAYDATAIINHPDRTKDAKDLYHDRAIGKKAYREALGFAEEDAPTDDELAEFIGVAVRDASLAWYGIPSLKAGGIEPEAGVVEKPGTEGGEAGTPTASTGAEVEPGPPKGAPAPEGEMVGALAARVMGASDLALLRCREAAGNRLLALAKRDPDLKEKLRGVRTNQVAYTLGRDAVRSLRAPSEQELVAGTRPLVEDALRVFGIADPEVVEKIAAAVEQQAARTLYEPRAALPSTFQNYVVGLIVGR